MSVSDLGSHLSTVQICADFMRRNNFMHFVVFINLYLCLEMWAKYSSNRSYAQHQVLERGKRNTETVLR